MTDTELVDFVERHGVQVWPERMKSQRGPQGDQRVRRVPGEILGWTAQFPHPCFIQVSRTHWRHAVADLIEVYNQKILNPSLI